MIGITLQDISCFDVNIEDINMGIQLKGFTIEEPEPEEVIETKAEEIEPVKVSSYIHGEVEDTYKEDVQRVLNDLPYIKKYIKRNKWKIICKDTRVYGANSGVIDYKEKTIELCATEEISTYFIHECGHLLDYMLQYTLNNEKFTKVYQEEVDKMRKIDGVEIENTRNEKEYFAECFRLYEQKNESFKDLTSSYGVIERIVKEYEEK